MILAIDTATKWMGLALHDGRAVVAEIGWKSSNTHTVELAPSVADMLRRSEIEAVDLSAIAVAIGPGSYTGLRIGLGFAKGLALANQTKLIGVPTLDILAAATPRAEGQLIVIAEAGRTRVSAGAYTWQLRRGWKSLNDTDIVTWEELLDQVEEPATFTGEITPEAAKLIRASEKDLRMVSAAQAMRRAGYLAEIGWQRFRRKKVDDPAELVPIYLRDPAGA